MTAKLRGTGRDLSIRNLTGNMGATKISGSGTYVDKSPRPSVKLALKSSAIPLSDYLEASSESSPPSKSARGQSSTGRQPASQPDSRWSRETIDTGAFGLVDADIDLGADALAVQKLPRKPAENSCHPQERKFSIYDRFPARCLKEFSR